MNDENHQKLIPKWMKIKYENNKKEDIFKPVRFNPIGGKSQKMMMLVDKKINSKKIDGYNPSRSIFRIQDFRHSVMTKKEQEYYDSMVNQNPIRFFEWDDGKKFNPKYKKDI